MATESPPTGSLMRWALPVGLFVVIVGAIAWVSQNLPKGAIQKTNSTNVIDTKDKPSDLRFLSTRATWDDKDPNYCKEFEIGAEGHYDFPFLNPGSEPVTLGLAQSSCDCTQLQVVVLEPKVAANLADLHAKNPTEFPVDPDWTWTALAVANKAGVPIPAGGGGVARVHWDGRKSAGTQLKLSIKMWMHPAGKPGERTFEILDVPIVMADPIRFSSERVLLGVVGAGGQVSGEVLAWSATRDIPDLQADPAKTDSLFSVAIDKLDAKAAAELQDKFYVATTAHLEPKARDERLTTLRETAKATRYRSAFRVVTTLREQKGDKQLEQGPFTRELPVIAPSIPYDFHKPAVTAFVRGDVDVGITEDGGKINLSFRAKDGIKKTIPLWSDSGSELEIESFYPTVLNPKLTRNAKESTAGRNKWSLEIVVPPGAWSGPFLEDSVIFLRTKTTPPRRIRIPVVGNAGQG